MRSNFQSLSLFRILVTIYLGSDLLFNVWPWYGDFYRDHGVLPRAVLLAAYHGRPVPSLLMLSDHPGFHIAFLSLYTFALLAFGIGYRTRLATLLVLVCFSSLYWRDPLPNSGAEMLVRLFLLWGLFLPLSRYWSIDAALDRQVPDRPFPILPLKVMRVQLAMVYILSVLNKAVSPAWLDGSALKYLLEDNLFGGTIGGLWLIKHCAGLLPFLGWGVIGFQFLFTLLVYLPNYNGYTRSFALAGAAVMHGSFIFLLTVGLFPYICLIYLLILIPDDWWNNWLTKRRARLAKITLYYDPGCVFCEKITLLFRSFCLVPASPVLPADVDPAILDLLRVENSWVVITSDGEKMIRWRAVAYVLRQSPVFWAIGRATDRPFLRRPMQGFYNWIGNHRSSLGKITSMLLPFRTQPVPGVVLQTLCATLMALAFIYSGFALPRTKVKSETGSEMIVMSEKQIPAWLDVASTWLQVKQTWKIFAPNPVHREQYFFFSGRQADGLTVDLLSRWHPAPFLRAKNGYRVIFANHNVQKLLERLPSLLATHPDAFTAYLCRKVNNDATAETFIKTGHILYLRRSLRDQTNQPMLPKIDLKFSCVPSLLKAAEMPKPADDAPKSQNDEGSE